MKLAKTALFACLAVAAGTGVLALKTGPMEHSAPVDDEFFRRSAVAVDLPFEHSAESAEHVRAAVSEELGVAAHDVLVAALGSGGKGSRVTVRLAAPAVGEAVDLAAEDHAVGSLTHLADELESPGVVGGPGRSEAHVAAGLRMAGRVRAVTGSMPASTLRPRAKALVSHPHVDHVAHGRVLRSLAESHGAQPMERSQRAPRVNGPLGLPFLRAKEYAPGRVKQSAKVELPDGSWSKANYHIVLHESTVAVDGMPEVLRVSATPEKEEGVFTISLVSTHPLTMAQASILLVGREWDALGDDASFSGEVLSVDTSLESDGTILTRAQTVRAEAHRAAALYEVDTGIHPSASFVEQSRRLQSDSTYCKAALTTESVKELSASFDYEGCRDILREWSFNYDFESERAAESQLSLLGDLVTLDNTFAYADLELDFSIVGGANAEDGETLRYLSLAIAGNAGIRVEPAVHFPKMTTDAQLEPITDVTTLDDIEIQVGSLPVVIGVTTGLYSALHSSEDLELGVSGSAAAHAGASFGFKYENTLSDPNDDTCQCLGECSATIEYKWCYVSENCKSRRSPTEDTYTSWMYCSNFVAGDTQGFSPIRTLSWGFDKQPFSLTRTKPNGRVVRTALPSFDLDVDVAMGITLSLYHLVPVRIYGGTTLRFSNQNNNARALTYGYDDYYTSGDDYGDDFYSSGDDGEEPSPSPSPAPSAPSDDASPSGSGCAAGDLISFTGGETFVDLEIEPIKVDLNTITGMNTGYLSDTVTFTKQKTFPREIITPGSLWGSKCITDADESSIGLEEETDSTDISEVAIETDASNGEGSTAHFPLTGTALIGAIAGTATVVVLVGALLIAMVLRRRRTASPELESASGATQADGHRTNPLDDTVSP